jgi:hypothetical protein
MKLKEPAVYEIKPVQGGVTGDVLIATEKGQPVCLVKSKVFSPEGRTYVVQDSSKREIMRTTQAHTFLFPRHTLTRGGKAVADIRQSSIVPQKYYVSLVGGPDLEVRIGAFDAIFRLHGATGTAAEIGQHRSSWIVVVQAGWEPEVILVSVAVIYRESTTGV